jgi:hypothetical protein
MRGARIGLGRARVLRIFTSAAFGQRLETPRFGAAVLRPNRPLVGKTPRAIRAIAGERRRSAQAGARAHCRAPCVNAKLSKNGRQRDGRRADCARSARRFRQRFLGHIATRNFKATGFWPTRGDAILWAWHFSPFARQIVEASQCRLPVDA